MNYEFLTKSLTKIQLIKKIEYLLKIHNSKFDEIIYLQMDLLELKEIYIGYLQDFNKYPVEIKKVYFKEKLLNLEIYLN